MAKVHIGFIGAGGIARAHAYALGALKFYYDTVPDIILESVTSSRDDSRQKFRKKYGFRVAENMLSFISNNNIDTVFILGPNVVHFEHLDLALKMPGVRNIYIEKPVCVSQEEEKKMHRIIADLSPDQKIQVGFQFLQSPSIREALNFWKSGILGNPIHFDVKYYHGDYLQPGYRKKRATRLTPAPDGGAMADLGSHVISLMMAFLGDELQILHAMQGGGFEDVPINSDLFSSISLFDPVSKAVGSLSASRISTGTGDRVDLELYADKGSLKYSSLNPDFFEYFLESEQRWERLQVGSNYKPITSFPSGHVPPGWLRSMIHAHYIFLTGDSRGSVVPDLTHGLSVQRIVRETADHMDVFRDKVREI